MDGVRLRVTLVAAAVAVTSLIAAAPGQAWTDNPTEGCTPGFWKNHTEDWVDYTPDQTLGSVFTFPNAADPFADRTLLEALSFSGGPTKSGKKALLLHHAVAALLNSTSGIDYGVLPTGVISSVNKALLRDKGGLYEWLKDKLDARNNLGCPL